jgi:hypothetical protein
VNITLLNRKVNFESRYPLKEPMALEIITAGTTIVKLFIRFGESFPHASCNPSNEKGEGGSHIVVTSAYCGVLSAAIIIT